MSDAWICDFARTPFGRFGGCLASVRTDDLAAVPLVALMKRNPGLAESLDEVIMGCANQAGEDNRNVARMAALLAGLPDSVPGVTVNRLCASGLEAVGMAARAIQTGEMHLVLAGGVESMTRAPLVMAKAERAFQRTAEIFDTTLGWRFINPLLRESHGVDPLPETAENVAREFRISREDQDAFAYRSQMRTAAAGQTGRLAAAIVPLEVSAGKGTVRTVDQDEHPRPETTLEALARLRSTPGSGGTVTAGNASGINDGAAALVLASSAAVKKFGLNPRARVAGMASAGVPPRIMGMGPVPATRKLLDRLGWSLDAIDVIELNEAFASQALACLREFGLPDNAEHVNPNGGAIALGHPLGASGARILGFAVDELVRRGGQRALATMCVGVGQGLTMAIDREGL
jgi:3-oxoadipyl-CoA thiolase